MSSTTAPGPKAAHYEAALTAALLKGSWADSTPGAAPNGTGLSWGELIRKWGKHTGGNTALIHHLRDISLLYQSTSIASSGFLTIPQPSTTTSGAQASSAGVGGAGGVGSIQISPSTGVASGSTNSSADETTTQTSGSSFIHVPHPHLHRHKSRPSLDTPSSHGTVRPAGTSTRAAYLSAGDLDGDDIPDEGFWGVGNGWWSGVGPEGVDEVREGIKALELLITNGRLKAGELVTAKELVAYHLHAIGSHEKALQIYDQPVNPDPQLGAVRGDAAVLDRIRAKCFQGLSYELLPSPDARRAFSSYLSIIPLTRSLNAFSPAIPSYIVSPPPKVPFDSHRELHRYLSTALSRAAILSARQADNATETLRVLRTYHAYAASWPFSFRPIQRQRMLLLYLRALYIGHPAIGEVYPPFYTYDETIQTPALAPRSLWRKEVSEALKLGRSLLSSTTSFPRAGSINAPVTGFTNLAVALADRSPRLAREVISILWWSMTLTFQSQSVLRNLTRLLTSVGDSADARRTFELYVQLVLKAKETQQPEISLQLKRRPTEDAAASPREIQREVEEAETSSGIEAEEKRAQFSETEIDNDPDFVRALLVGSRLLLRDLGEVEEAWRYVCLAGDVIDSTNGTTRRVSKALRAEVEESKGIVRMTMGMKGADPITRPTYQAQAINHLTAATTSNPESATAHYHLSFCQAEARATESSSHAIRRSLELDSRNVQAWHLLALILTAENDWEGAMKACEAGNNIWDQDEETAEKEDDGGGGGSGEASNGYAVTDPNVTTKDFATDDQPVEIVQARQEPLLLPSGHFDPPTINSRPIKGSLNRATRLEHIIRLRMTLNVITEKTQGPEVAMLKQQELFAFFSLRSGKQRSSTVNGNGSTYGRGMTGSTSFSSVPGGGPDLGGSYISVNVTQEEKVEDPAPALGQINSFAVRPPTPDPEKAVNNPLNTPQRYNPVSVTASSSPGASTAGSETDSPGEQTQTEKSKEGRDGRTKRLVARHLHVPLGGGSGRSSRPSSVRRLQVPDDLRTSLQRNRAASSSSIAMSVAPTAVHSHFQGSTASTPPPPPPIAKNAESRTAAELRILSNLWLMSAATFRRWSKPEQCLVSIEEAEVLDPENPDVWVQLGLYHFNSSPPNYEAALPAFTKAILLRPDHPPSLVNLAKLYLTTGQIELAHSLLNQFTQDSGWDIPEAWYYLGKVCEIQERSERAEECFRYALGLEQSRPCRRWGEGVERWL